MKKGNWGMHHISTLQRNCHVDGRFCYEYVCDTDEIATWKDHPSMKRWMCPKLSHLEENNDK